MNLIPFGMPKSSSEKTTELSTEALIRYEQKLADYRNTLEKYKRCILEYSGKLDGFDQRSMDNQLSIVQTALDLTYLKEQGGKQIEALNELKANQVNKVQVQLENLVASLIDTNFKLDGVDKSIINRLSEIQLELQKQILFQNNQLNSELAASVDKLTKSVRTNRAVLWFMFTFQIISLGAIAYLILYNLDLLPY
ncbi:MAG TPA: hypothetical protein VN131_03700 [Mobilitalea sp.]|nr:hypothetical protein [Mobilitalea sp.]